jgi:hypothetical protein
VKKLFTVPFIVCAVALTFSTYAIGTKSAFASTTDPTTSTELTSDSTTSTPTDQLADTSSSDPLTDPSVLATLDTSVDTSPVDPSTSTIDTSIFNDKTGPNYVTAGPNVAAGPPGGGGTTYTKSTTKQLYVWLNPISTNPLHSLVNPTTVTVDLPYTYYINGTYKWFKSITASSIKSYADGIPMNWVETSTPLTSISTDGKKVTITLIGYELLGVSIAGQPIGAKFSDTIKFTYNIDQTSQYCLEQ